MKNIHYELSVTLIVSIDDDESPYSGNDVARMVIRQLERDARIGDVDAEVQACDHLESQHGV